MYLLYVLQVTPGPGLGFFVDVGLVSNMLEQEVWDDGVMVVCGMLSTPRQSELFEAPLPPGAVLGLMDQGSLRNLLALVGDLAARAAGNALEQVRGTMWQPVGGAMVAELVCNSLADAFAILLLRTNIQ